MRATVSMPAYSLIVTPSNLAGILIRVDPSPMQIAVIVGGKAGDIDAGITVVYVGHVFDLRV
nr:hypothetical protein [Marinicella sp. W31]MDC2878248.1 hypothetical protein [Marinicella sp. W31]